MKLRDCRMDRIAHLAAFPISHSIPVFGRIDRPEARTLTIVQRLAHLISKLETMDRHSSAVGSKWYLHHLAEVSLPESLKTLIEPFVTRLRADIDKFEERHGTVDSDEFDRRLEFAGVTRQQILYGPPSPWACMGPVKESPKSELDCIPPPRAAFSGSCEWPKVGLSLAAW
jgi:hypothetical protein